MSQMTPQRMAEAYGRLLAEVLRSEGAAEDEVTPVPLSELAIQELWEAGLLGNEGVTEAHGPVRILDYGVWNRGPGPDFLGAEIELNGTRMRGDVEIDPHAQDWERHGHGASKLYNRVVLHVTLAPPPQGWYTRNELHYEVPVLYLPPERVRAAMGMAPPLDRELTPLCRGPLAEAGVQDIESLLMAAAAHRAACKRKRFYRKAEALGLQQAWYEAWAEALGYSANKATMMALARRAPLAELGGDAEGILFGTAGFLVPVLPDATSEEARLYHREVWGTWWKHQERYALAEGRALPWAFAGLRPLNHPHRRVAALAVSVQQWQSIAPLLNVGGAARLTKLLESLSHPFWDYHCTLTSEPRPRRAALVGHERARDFLVNSVYVLDETPGAWEAYLKLKNAQAPTRVQRTATHLFGDREDVEPLLHHHFARQGLLQIEADFCSCSNCSECLFPEQLSQWRLR